MFKRKNKTIYATRGDKGTIRVSIKNYIFQPNDVVAFRVYNANALDKEAVLIAETTVEEETNVVEINIASADMKIGDMENKPIKYWYEIELNGEETIESYDDKGVREFILYPEGFVE